jgi:hypothetical protein
MFTQEVSKVVARVSKYMAREDRKNKLRILYPAYLREICDLQAALFVRDRCKQAVTEGIEPLDEENKIRVANHLSHGAAKILIEIWHMDNRRRFDPDKFADLEDMILKSKRAFAAKKLGKS